MFIILIISNCIYKKDSIVIGSTSNQSKQEILRFTIERYVIPNVLPKINPWRCFEYDTIAYIKLDTTDYVLTVLGYLRK